MKNSLGDLQIATYVGAFALYPTANFAIVVSADASKTAMPKYRSTPTLFHPRLGDGGLHDGLREAIAGAKPAVLLFADWRSFRNWLAILPDLLAELRT